MPWVRLDETFPLSLKIIPLSNDALALWVCGLAFCNKALTDGYIPRQVALGQLRLCPDYAAAIGELEAQGLWEPVEDGWTVHDYHDYQPSKADVLELRASRQAAGAKGGRLSSRAKDKHLLKQNLSKTQANHQANGQANAQAKSKPVPVPVKNNLRGADAPDAQTLVAHLVNEHGRLGLTLPEQSKGHAAQRIKALLNDGMPAPVIRAALTQTVERGRPIAALTDIARELQATGPPTERPKTGTYAMLPLAG